MGKEKASDKVVLRPRVEPEWKERDENLIQLGKFFYTLASLTFAGAVLMYLTDFSAEKQSALAVSMAGFFGLAWLGWAVTKRGNIKR